MQLILSALGQKPRLADWSSRPFSATVEIGPELRDRRDCFERQVAVEPAGEPLIDGPFRRVARSVLAYCIFPPSLISSVLARSPLEVGDTVGILYRYLPGVQLFCAARVMQRFDEEQQGIWRTGFTYRTLAGHPETGEETFSVEKDLTTGTVLVALRSWSRPGIWLTRLVAPYTRHIQVHANNAALAHLARVATDASTS